jgi:hypothetical protein
VDTVAAGELLDVPVPSGGGTVSAAASSSPSQERLVRIAAMIRDAERGLPVARRRERRPQGAVGAIPLIPRRPASLRRTRSAA